MSFSEPAEACVTYYGFCWLLHSRNKFSWRPPQVMASSFPRSLLNLLLRLSAWRFWTSQWCAYSSSLTASYSVRVPQYRALQSRFLHCMPHGKPACDLLMVQGLTPAHKGLSPSRLTHIFIWKRCPCWAHTICKNALIHIYIKRWQQTKKWDI